MAGQLTPVMRQHAAAKAAHPDAVVFFRLGDFYETFGEDAVLCAGLLDITLTRRNDAPMAGVPAAAVQTYTARLLRAGHKVAVCEQMADPATVKGIVPREVVRVLTPGLVTDEEHLQASENHWLAAVEVRDGALGLALLDFSTSECLAAIATDASAAAAELARLRPREVLVGATGAGPECEARVDALRAALAAFPGRRDEPLGSDEAGTLLAELGVEHEGLDELATAAAARALRYARRCNPQSAVAVLRVAAWEPSRALLIDETTQGHLELVRSNTGERVASLLGVIDSTLTAPGARLLRRRLLAPLIDVERIRRRLSQVRLFVENAAARERLRGCLGHCGDLERLATRTVLGQATPRDLGVIRDGLAAAARAEQSLRIFEAEEARALLGLSEPIDLVADLADLLRRALVERPPAQTKEGGIFLEGYDAELDRLAALKRDGSERVTALEARLRERTGIAAVRIRYTRVFGWYIELTRAQASRAPSEWRRKQTVATGERFTLPELDDLADELETAEERRRERELVLLAELTAEVALQAERLTRLARRLARWDVAAALADVAHRHDYREPVIEESGVLELTGARHPVVERLVARGRFVPNDLALDSAGARLHLVTGPNMGGKSTLLRQAALAVILAQMGSWVPAERARVGLVDRVLSRVGASDNVARGESTFMVEMRETAGILRHATRRSLVILDEIGRGTSTYDGLGIAWAVAEYLDDVIGCRTLFATHYHELTTLAEQSEHVRNFSVTARELEGELVFLHRVVEGPANRSYGVHIARLAGLPAPAVARAQALVDELERARTTGASTVEVLRARAPRPGGRRGRAPDNAQLTLFAPEGPTAVVREGDAPAPMSGEAASSAALTEVVRTLAALDLDDTTPMQALKLLARLQKRLR